MQQRFEVLTIGNAIVDVLAHVDDAFITREGLNKGIMHLTEWDKAEYLYAAMPEDKLQMSGGSAGNTAAGVASLGGAAAFVGKVADDPLGEVFGTDMRAVGAHFATPPLEHGSATARSMILITPDGERTMNTYLGACHELTVTDITDTEIGAAAITYMEGFLWDPPEAKRAFVKAAKIAHSHDRKTAITLSDPFCVDRFRAEFLDLIRSGTIDILFANEAELKSLYQVTDLDHALESVAKDCGLAVVTRGAEGALAVQGGDIVRVPAHPVAKVVDATGAGDQFAAGFLLGHARGKPLDVALTLGCLCAAEVIAHTGARPLVSLAEFAAQNAVVI